MSELGHPRGCDRSHTNGVGLQFWARSAVFPEIVRKLPSLGIILGWQCAFIRVLRPSFPVMGAEAPWNLRCVDPITVTPGEC